MKSTLSLIEGKYQFPLVGLIEQLPSVYLDAMIFGLK